MNPKNINNPKVQKVAYKNRVELRERLEDKVAVLNPIDHSNRYRQLIGQLLRLDKKIEAYEKQFGTGNSNE
jgi:DNA primase